jgi:D-alanine-D-alanine ligase
MDVRLHAFLRQKDSLLRDLRERRIALLVGGDSEERDASLYTGAAVAAELRAHGIEPTVVDTAETPLAAGLVGCDLVLSCLHGGSGEDGRMSAQLDALRIPYAFSGTAACAVTMHKPFFKAVVASLGLLTPPAKGAADVYIHKRIAGGGSIGMFVDDRPTTDRSGYFTEAFIDGTVLTVGVLERDGEVIPLPIVRIDLGGKGFYDEQAKYEDGFATAVAYTGAHGDRIAEAATRLMRNIGLRGAARFDLIETDRGDLYFLEANAIPGLYHGSNLVTAAGLAGVSFIDLLVWLLAGARYDAARL